MLRPLQTIFKEQDYPDLLIGLARPDDAAAWRLDDSRILVATTDFFTPVVDDPYDYGAIAAANALSDVYAMGATPFLVLNLAAMPPNLPTEIVSEIFRGGAEKVQEAGAVVAGGHSVQDEEPKFGLVAIGFCDQDKLMTKANARPGEVLVLTKPLGTGVISTALKRGDAKAKHVQQAVTWMKQLNEAAAKLAADHGVRAATDVTGYGLLGHAMEMADISGVGLRIHVPSVPFLPGTRMYAEGGYFPGGSADNRLSFGDRVTFAESIDEYTWMMLFDAQTSGGLLLAVPQENLQALLKQASKDGVPAWPIGMVEEGEGIRALDTPFGTPPVADKRWEVEFERPR